MQQGKIGVTTENIFPVIKKFLYSDQEIFLREIVSNAIDATQKLRALSQSGVVKGELGDLTIRVRLDPDAGTLTLSDRGIGMTAEEVDKYINQIAFSGADEFLKQYKDAQGIIGHFGLGFYSAFMVSKQVEILTKSYQEEAQAVRWSCDGTPSFEMEEIDKAERGTDIVLHIDDDSKQFLEKETITGLLRKYCHFLPVPIAFGKKQEWKDGKYQDTDEDNIINDTDPIWRKKPVDLKDEDYAAFYRDLFPMNDEPLFHIHLNVDYPFNLTGVLYFPKIKQNIDLQRNQIQLYCNQVFVTDKVDGIVPEFLTLLHGVIDSPDIPLNVSRSYLQSDSNVKKISGYITRKVNDRLKSIFSNDRKLFEEKWDDLKLFIHYGMLSEQDYFDKAKEYALLKDTEGKYFTYEEYAKLIEGTQKDKDGHLVYLYATNLDEQYSYIDAAKQKGYSVLLMDGQLDMPLVSQLEQKLGQCSFRRVDSDTIDKLIPKEEAASTGLSDEEQKLLTEVFDSQAPEVKGSTFHSQVQAMGSEALPLMMVRNEWSRRMKDMSKLQSGMSFYGEMPDMLTIVLNSDHPLVRRVLAEAGEGTRETLAPIDAELRGLNARKAALRQQIDGAPDHKDEEAQKQLSETEEQIDKQEEARRGAIGEYAKGAEIVHQLIDLALLQNGMLKGEALSRFLRRSVDLIK